ncbi:dUTP diphosphatase [Pseudactinotalea sp.]|uniref:dUTP diphosphatase n=1 Tax=Pseudactinotalea sp. TaxID=1926260 RepID=UPI003B3AA2F2
MDPEPVQVLVHRLDPELPLPGYAHPGDAGLDLVSREDVTLPPAGRAAVATGVAIALPAGYVGLVHPRSGLARKHGVTVLNAPGTVDAGYRGEIQVILANTDPQEAFTVRRGDRVAQLVVQQVAQADLVEVDTLPGSDRGEGGFGSTGGFGATTGEERV